MKLYSARPASKHQLASFARGLFIRTSISSFALLMLSGLAFGQDAKTAIDLQLKFPTAEQCRISANYQYVGDVIVIPAREETAADPQDPKQDSKPAKPQPNKAQLLPLKVEANFDYFQRMTKPTQAVRYYQAAKGDIELNKTKRSSELAGDNRLIIARLSDKAGVNIEMASIASTLVQGELELIQNPLDPLTICQVLSRDNVKQGDEWKPDDKDLAKLLGVNEISESDVKVVLKKVEPGKARLYLMGSVDAIVNDSTTKMEISGIVSVDLDKQIVTALKAGIKELRNPGQIAPGFDGDTKIILRCELGKETPQLANAALRNQTADRRIRQRLEWASEGNFVLTYEPRWKLIASEPEAAVLRFVDGGELLTQCNLVQLPARPADKPLTLEEYKAEVAKVIKLDKNAQILDAQASKTETGLNAHRVVVGGEEQGLPVNWYYYHVANHDGRQVTFVFTLTGEVSDRVASVAQQLVDEFKFDGVRKTGSNVYRPAKTTKPAAKPTGRTGSANSQPLTGSRR